MRINRQQLDCVLVACLLTPDACPGVEELFRPGQSAFFVLGAGFQTSLFEGDLVGLPGDTNTAEVANVFTDGEAAVDLVGVVELFGGELVVLADQAGGALLECLAVFFGPPVVQAAGAVVVIPGRRTRVRLWPMTAPIPP